MSGFQSKLRTRLQENNPELADALERSWKVAQEEWLPTIGLNRDSFNSYPHIRNLELHLERLLFSETEGTLVIEKIGLTSLELYLLLAGVLFHDIGRTKGKDAHHIECCDSTNPGATAQSHHADVYVVDNGQACIDRWFQRYASEPDTDMIRHGCLPLLVERIVTLSPSRATAGFSVKSKTSSCLALNSAIPTAGQPAAAAAVPMTARVPCRTLTPASPCTTCARPPIRWARAGARTATRPTRCSPTPSS